MWTQATISTIEEEDLDPGYGLIAKGSGWSNAPADPSPGKAYFHQGDQLFYVWTDALDVDDNGRNTGVSLWLAWGPDRLETACLTAEPVPAGAGVVLTGTSRNVRLPYTADDKVIGVNQSGIPDAKGPGQGDTAASGTWIRVAIDGIARVAVVRPTPGTESFSVINPFHSLTQWGTVPVDDQASNHNRGTFIGNGNAGLRAGSVQDTLIQTFYNVTVASGYTAVYPHVRWLGPHRQ